MFHILEKVEHGRVPFLPIGGTKLPTSRNTAVFRFYSETEHARVPYFRKSGTRPCSVSAKKGTPLRKLSGGLLANRRPPIRSHDHLCTNGVAGFRAVFQLLLKENGTRPCSVFI